MVEKTVTNHTAMHISTTTTKGTENPILAIPRLHLTSGYKGVHHIEHPMLVAPSTAEIFLLSTTIAFLVTTTRTAATVSEDGSNLNRRAELCIDVKTTICVNKRERHDNHQTMDAFTITKMKVTTRCDNDSS